MHYRNFDTLRLVMATSVVFSHSFLLAENTERREPFVQLFGPGNIVGLYGVYGFFVISGFLVTRSYRRHPSWRAFVTSRSLRIFPGLLVVAVVCSFLIGPVATTLPLGSYLTDPATYAFVPQTVLMNPGAVLPSVRFSDTDVGSVVIGTLWTLRPEVICYVLVVAAGTVRLLRLPVLLLVLVAALWTHTAHPATLEQLGYLVAYFAAGSALWLIHETHRPGRAVTAASAVGMAASAALGFPQEGFAVFGAVLLIQLGTTNRVSLGNGARFGDLSYGIYLYGWPVQQTLVWLSDGSLDWGTLFALSLPLAAACAWLSFRFVEHPAIALGHRIRRASEGRRVPASVQG